MRTVILTTCENAAEAHIIQGALENEGIESILHNEIMSTMLPNYYGIMGMGVQVLVLEKDYEQALKIVEAGRPLNGTLCPYCGSSQISRTWGKRKGLKAFFAAISILSCVPLGNIKTIYRCHQCGEEFETPVTSVKTDE